MALTDSDTGTQTAFAVIAGVAAILVGFVVLVFYFVRDKGMMKEIVEMQRRFDTLKGELQAEQQKKMFKYSKGTQEFLKQYKKPMLQSAFDLQSRLTNQVKNNFLYSFLQERGGERDQNYALYNFSFVFAEFLGWLEVIRQELVFITGDVESVQLGSLIEGIKFQLTGETPVQGTAPRGQEDDPEFEGHSRIFQLYAGELRSIGSVMIHTDPDGHKTIINADEFQRLMTVPAPSTLGGVTNEKARIDWARSRERLFQDMLLPLFGHLRTMATLPKGQAPIRRLAILQVLLAKLIDMVDNAVPWASGPKFDAGEEPQYITRDFRLTPLVAYLNSHQRKWLAVQPFMETADRIVADPLWLDHMEGREPYWTKLCFAGFREDLSTLPQDVRDGKPDMWPGACPPRELRQRPDHYIERRRDTDRRHKGGGGGALLAMTHTPSKNIKTIDSQKSGGGGQSAGSKDTAHIGVGVGGASGVLGSSGAGLGSSAAGGVVTPPAPPLLLSHYNTAPHVRHAASGAAATAANATALVRAMTGNSTAWAVTVRPGVASVASSGNGRNPPGRLAVVATPSVQSLASAGSTEQPTLNQQSSDRTSAVSSKPSSTATATTTTTLPPSSQPPMSAAAPPHLPLPATRVSPRTPATQIHQQPTPAKPIHQQPTATASTASQPAVAAASPPATAAALPPPATAAAPAQQQLPMPPAPNTTSDLEGEETGEGRAVSDPLVSVSTVAYGDVSHSSDEEGPDGRRAGGGRHDG